MKIHQTNKLSKNNLSGGYTLVELLAVTAIIVIVSGLIVGILYSTLRGGNKAKVTNDVAQNGNYALTVISRTALLSESVTKIDGNEVEDCTNPTTSTGKSIELKQSNGQLITFFCGTNSMTSDTNVIASSSGSVTANLIDKRAVQVDVDSCSFTCSQNNGNAYSQPVIKVGFTIKQRTNSNLFESVATSTFSTSVTMRNYSPK